MKCEKCGKSLLLFRKKFYDYRGKKKASFEITVRLASILFILTKNEKQKLSEIE